MRNLLIFLALFVTILGPAAVIVAISYRSIRAPGRNAASAHKIRIAVLTALVIAAIVSVTAKPLLFYFFAK